MATTNIPANPVCDLYREHVTLNGNVYTSPVSDDFRQNAVDPATPFNPTLTRSPAYPNQQLVRTWQEQLRQLENQT
jgi:hypothetical protein